MSLTNGVLTALPAPDGYVVDFDNPNQIGHIAGYWTTGVGLAIATTFLCIRLYTRIFISRNFGIEDVAVILSFAFGSVTQGILLDNWIIKAAGVHAWEMPFERYQHFTLIIMVASICYVPCLGFAKISILILYHRLSKLAWFKICTYIVMAIVASYSIGIVLALIFPCQPIAMNWDLSITEGKCIDKAGIYLATAAVNVITDFIILALPIPVVLRLQMRRTKKIAVIGLFMVGSATFITSIVRLVYMVPMVKNFDQTRVVSIPCVWIQVEANLVVLATSLPTLRTFLRHFFPSIFEDSQAPGYNGGSGLKNYYKKHSHGASASKGRNGTFDGSTRMGTNNSISGRYGRMGSSSKSFSDDTKELTSVNDHHLDHELEIRHLKHLDGVYDSSQNHHNAAAYPGHHAGDHNRSIHVGGAPYKNRRRTSRGHVDLEANADHEIADDGSDKAIWQTKTVTVERTR